MSAKSALIWISVFGAIILILVISWQIYKRFIAKYFNPQSSTEGQAVAAQEGSNNRIPVNTSYTGRATAPAYDARYFGSDAPPTYAEAVGESAPNH